MQRFTGLIGLAVILGVAFLFSSNRKAIQPRIVLWGLGLQFSFAFLVLKTPLAEAFTALSNGINHVLGYAAEGSKFVFGNNLGGADGGFGVILAFQILPIIIFLALQRYFVRGLTAGAVKG